MKYTIDLGIRPPYLSENDCREIAKAHLANQGKTIIDAYPIEDTCPKFSKGPRDLWCVETD